METTLKDGRKIIHLTDAETTAFVNEDTALKSAFELTQKRASDKIRFNNDFMNMLRRYSAICNARTIILDKSQIPDDKLPEVFGNQR